MPHRPFPFDLSACALPTQVPDCHLVRTVIPRLPLSDSLGDFHHKASPDLSLFCRYGFRKRYSPPKWPQWRIVVLPSPHTHARQATLHTAHDSAHCLAGSHQIRMRAEPHRGRLPSSHGKMVSTESGSYAPCHWSAPAVLNPQHPPETGRNKQTQGTSSMCPSQDF